jgi:glutamate 5-kinase
MRIVIKVGTQSILSEDGNPLEAVINNLVTQIAALQKIGHQIILVSSGAVGYGRKVARSTLSLEFGNTIGEKQVLASLGQHELMRIYAEKFRSHNILVSQLLLTKQDFHTRQHYLNIARLLRETLQNKNIIPIINENDTVAIQELMFTDNDELAGLIAAQIPADKLIILSNVEGVFTSHPSDPTAKIIHLIKNKQDWPTISSAKSAQGRGGMISKIATARKMSLLGITTHIASSQEAQVLLRILDQEQLGTTILPSKKKSNYKRWMAYHSHNVLGGIVIDNGLYTLLKEKMQVTSILPIGIEQLIGTFNKGDLVEILAPTGEKIGIGKTRYCSEKLVEYFKKQHMPELIHYNQLHIYDG